VAGSYVTEDKDIYMVVRSHDVEEAARDLYRIGLDNIVGYCTPEDLLMYKEHGGKIQAIEMVTFDEAVSGDPDGLILDVRKATEYEESHIEGALNIAHTRLLSRIDEIPNDRKIYVHCMTGARSAVAAAFLQSEGFDVAQVDDIFTDYMSKVASA
jgi:hydroxyacylglutathione hydrolase